MYKTYAQSPQGNRSAQPRGPGRKRARWALLGTAVLLAGFLPTLPAQAGHDPVNIALAGSNFEIDVDANLKKDHTTDAAAIDWATVTESRKGEFAEGSADDAFGQGSKEDTPVPTPVTGSIPPNKSDLKAFGTYLETTTSGARFMHMFWQRVQDPQGTTNMDFAFNKSKVLSSNGVTPVRTRGDKLIQYDLANGGTVAQLFVSTWLTALPAPADTDPCEAANSYPCWGERINLTSSGDATGSINRSSIPSGSGEDDGLGAMDPRTFGEATVDLDAIAGTGCNSFGSAYLKSRSSDSFSAALKDFIPPLAFTPTCGTLDITKKDDSFVAGTPDTPTALLPGVVFTLYEDVAPLGPGSPRNTTNVDPATRKSCTTGDGTGGTVLGKCSISDIPLGNYWVVETTPSGYAAAPEQWVSITSSTAVPLTFTNPRLFKVIVLVCKQADNSLYSSNVSLPSSTTAGDQVKSLGTSSDPTEAKLCGLTGATFANLQKGVKSVRVDIGVSELP